MIILTLRTDKPEAEIGIYKDAVLLKDKKWQAHRQLSETLHREVEDLIHRSDIAITDVGGIVFFEGPGSFTGLRIGAAFANALSYSHDIPCVSTGGLDWQAAGVQMLTMGKSGQAKPQYGEPPRTTNPKK